MDRRALPLFATLTWTAACPPNDDTTTGEPATQGSTSTGTTAVPTGPSTDPSASTGTDTGDTTAGDPTTSDTTSDTTTDTTTDTSTGDPASALHVLYSVRHPTLPPPTTSDLRHVVLTDEGAS